MLSTPIHIVTIALLLMQGRPSQTIIGKWEAVEASEGFCMIMEFGPRGVFYRSGGIRRSGTYRLEGSRILVDEAGLHNASEAREFRFEGDKLVFKDEGGELSVARVGRRMPNAPAIVGKWSVKGAFFHGGDNGSATFEFTQDGYFQFRTQTEPEKGRYQRRGKLLITRAGGEYIESPIRFEDGFLILQSRSNPGTEEKYRRIDR